MKTLRNYVVAGALYLRDTGIEAQVGDQVKLYLDTEAEPGFPEFIVGTVQHPITRVECNSSTSYNLEYNGGDLLGAATIIHADDIIDAVVVTALEVIADSVDTEIAARIAADTVLQTNITSEATTRAAADTVLQTNITSEATTRAAADTSEATTRAAADTVLQTNITSEATTRAAADTSEATTRAAADTSEATTRAAADTSEATTRAAADTVLQTNITSEANARAGLLTSGFANVPQALSGAGAINTTTLTTTITTTGVAQALTLSNGANGQIKLIVHDVDGGSAVLTPTTKTGFTTVTFTNAGDTVMLQFFTTRGWTVIASHGSTIA